MNLFVNKIILVGRVTTAPKPSGKAISLNIVTSVYSKKTTPPTQYSEFHYITVYNNDLKKTALTFNVGDIVSIEGRIHYYSYNNEFYKSASIIPEKLALVISKSHTSPIPSSDPITHTPPTDDLPF